MRYQSVRETINPHQYHFKTVSCPGYPEGACNQSTEEIVVEERDLFAYQTGAFIQQAFPYLSADQRERLISGMCGSCFDTMFPEDEE